MTITRSYDESTADDFRRLFAARFPDGDVALLDTLLSNPVRKRHPSTGSIACADDGTVNAILGLVPRIAYHGQRLLMLANGVAISVRKDADRDFFSGFIRDSVQAQGADMFFVNTAIPPSRKRVADALPDLADGPVSWTEIRERPVRGIGIVARLFGKLQKMAGGGAARTGSAPYRAECAGLTMAWETEIDGRTFDAFWERYLAANRGLVSSRTAEELRWAFGKGLATGEVVLLTARNDGGLKGYVFCRRTDETAACWRIVDMIALGNDEGILSALVGAITDFLRRRTPATCLQVTGFPSWVQPLFARLFPKTAAFGFNKCIWAYLKDEAKALCGDWVNAQDGWYGCPYDGDMCLL